MTTGLRYRLDRDTPLTDDEAADLAEAERHTAEAVGQIPGAEPLTFSTEGNTVHGSALLPSHSDHDFMDAVDVLLESLGDLAVTVRGSWHVAVDDVEIPFVDGRYDLWAVDVD